MSVLVDTPIWSLALRRRTALPKGPDVAHLFAMRDLIVRGEAKLIGPVRQEVLSGIREEMYFDRVRDQLVLHPDVALTVADYEMAARCSNRCRQQGIAGSSTDFLICSVALLRNWQIYSTDQDFLRFSSVLSISIFSPV